MRFRTILFDPEVYKNPEAFQPERFLKPNGEFNPDVFDPRQVIFGFGRRKWCVSSIFREM